MNKRIIFIVFVLAYQVSIVAMEESSETNGFEDYNIFKSTVKIQDLVEKLKKRKDSLCSKNSPDPRYGRSEKGLILVMKGDEFQYILTPWGVLNLLSDKSITEELLKKHIKVEFKRKVNEQGIIKKTYSILKIDETGVCQAKDLDDVEKDEPRDLSSYEEDGPAACLRIKLWTKYQEFDTRYRNELLESIRRDLANSEKGARALEELEKRYIK